MGPPWRSFFRRCGRCHEHDRRARARGHHISNGAQPRARHCVPQCDRRSCHPTVVVDPIEDRGIWEDPARSRSIPVEGRLRSTRIPGWIARHGASSTRAICMIGRLANRRRSVDPKVGRRSRAACTRVHHAVTFTMSLAGSPQSSGARWSPYYPSAIRPHSCSQAKYASFSLPSSRSSRSSRSSWTAR